MAPSKRERSLSPDATPVALSSTAADGDTVEHVSLPAASVKKRRVLAHESLYLSALPSAERYYKSLMHRDILSFVTVTPHSGFVITASADGHVKFWKKQEQGIEFVKHYRAHLAPVTAVSCSADGALYASVGKDGTAKVFDVVNFGESGEREERRGRGEEG